MWVDVLIKKDLGDTISKKIMIPISIWIGFLYLYMYALVSIGYTSENFDALSAYSFFIVIAIVLVLIGFLVNFHTSNNLDCGCNYNDTFGKISESFHKTKNF
jgi:hypothetical protein